MTDWTWPSPAPGSFDELNGTLNPSMKALENKLAVLTIQTELGVYTVEEFGAAGDGVTDDSAAFQAAIDAMVADGGGTVRLGPKTYLVSELLIENQNVLIEGVSSGYNQQSAKTASNLLCTSGVWCLKFALGAAFSGLKNVSLRSNHALAAAAPHAVTTTGVEYGIFIETGFTVMEDVTVYGFQVGCVQASNGNSNIFTRCAFVWNGVGFAITPGTAGGFAAYHPNITPTGTKNSTIMLLTSCVFRRNGWGIILRDGSPTFITPLIESNDFAGAYLYIGTLDSGIGGTWYSPYFENNWRAFDVTVTYIITEYNLLRDTVSTFIPFTIDTADTTKTDSGYQMFMGEVTEGTQTGPSKMDFYSPIFVLSTNPTGKKALYLKQCFQMTFYKGSSTGGDQTNAIRLGDDAGGTNFLANIVYFQQWNGTLPAVLKGGTANRGMSIIHSTSGVGGWVISGGFQSAQVTATSVFRTSTLTTLTDDATPSVAAGNIFKTGGTTTITDFDGGLVGQTIKILAAHSIKITDDAAIILAGGADYDMTDSDTLTLTMYNDQVWQEDSRSVN